MMELLASYGSVFDLVLVNAMLALSQYVVLRAGVFSLGSAAFAALGAYAAAILVMRFALPGPIALLASLAIGTAAGALVSLPLSRLRGVFQALATLALVQIVLSGTLNLVSITNGSVGINSIPRLASTTLLAAVLVVTVAFLRLVDSYGIGRAFNVIRQDETVAATLGIDVRPYHTLAFVLSGAIAGLAGGLQALSTYTISPSTFGFHMLVNVLAMVVLGGSLTVWGALAGAVILSVLPELFRVFADYRTVMQGVLLMVCSVYLPDGVADTLLLRLKRRRVSARVPAAEFGRIT